MMIADIEESHRKMHWMHEQVMQVTLLHSNLKISGQCGGNWKKFTKLIKAERGQFSAN